MCFTNLRSELSLRITILNLPNNRPLLDFRTLSRRTNSVLHSADRLAAFIDPLFHNTSTPTDTLSEPSRFWQPLGA